ncbi:MAG TPA: hypothetical protein VEA38_25515 [Terriglobales bacterium]|nr:hypothetical protein [Terriglobales bacterium]
MSDLSRYDGRRPEPPYPTDADRDDEVAALRAENERLRAALIGLALSGTPEEPLYSWCDDGWTCEHEDCGAARAALGHETPWDRERKERLAHEPGCPRHRARHPFTEACRCRQRAEAASGASAPLAPPEAG